MFLLPLPMRERGLKYVMPDEDLAKDLPLPMRERGLKYFTHACTPRTYGRSPCGGRGLKCAVH